MESKGVRFVESRPVGAPAGTENCLNICLSGSFCCREQLKMVMSFHFVPDLYPVDIISPLPNPQESTPPCSININISCLCFFNYHFDLKVTNVLNLDWENAEVRIKPAGVVIQGVVKSRTQIRIFFFFSVEANGLQIKWIAKESFKLIFEIFWTLCLSL